MKLKFFSLFILFIFVCLPAISEELPSASSLRPLNSNDNPVYYGYMKDYNSQLFQMFDAKKYGHRGWHCAYEYTIHKNGMVSDFKLYKHQNKLFNAYIKKIIVENPPKPFYKGMKEETIRVNTTIGKADFDNSEIDYFHKENIFWNKVYKDCTKVKQRERAKGEG